MNRIEEIKKQIQQLENQTKELQKELEFEEQKMEIQFPFNLKEDYYCLENDGTISKKWWSNNTFDKKRFRQGNIFKSEEEAERERDKRILLTRFRQFRDECNWRWKPDFENSWEDKYSIMFHYKSRKLKIANSGDYDNFRPFSYFKNESDAHRAIQLFGDEIKRLYVEEEK